MLDFEQLVEGLLLEGTGDVATKFATNIPGLTEADLEYLFINVIKPGASISAISTNVCENILNYIGVLDQIIKIFGKKSLSELRSELSKPTMRFIVNADNFYTELKSMSSYTVAKATPLTAIKINDLCPDVQQLYRKGITSKSVSAIKENIFNTLINETIINALIKIFQTRLNKLQQVKISVNMLVGHITNMNTSTYDVFLKDLFFNVANYASGKRPANKDIIDVLQDIRIEFEDLLNIVLQTNKLYTTYLRRNYPNWNSPGIDKTIYDKNNTPQMMYIFAKEGKITGSSGAGKGMTLIPGYNLTKIQTDNTEEGKELIKMIKDICAGINHGSGASERTANVGAAAGSLAAIGGVKSGFSM